ncbi:hypothetical protein BTHE68_04940 [Burkholderia sp. THE68]|uniref:Lcl C-terminal domain-containing protein n=1 Tax=Burkholderia sp. THE68 TaxID=758782 RepID=UPI001316A8E4|nr:DUF1566 domain-containing protein [Burkholderia sp. THE68]BBU26760.1 hypothetical protein BTHE68_04940 [Burkholderia sp. THE68]
MNIAKMRWCLPLVSLLSFLTCSEGMAACVRGFDKDITLQGDLAIIRKTGLIWKRCAVGREWDKNKQRCAGQPAGLSQDEARRAARRAGPGWRVPTGREMDTLRVNSCKGPKIDARAFPDVALSDFGEGAKFWTSTAAMPGTYYYFNLTDGSIDFHSAGFTLSVLLVRSVESQIR